MSYIELQVTTNFSFLRGASHPEELVEQAALLGYKKIAITDRNSVAGIVRAHAAAKKRGISIITGCRLDIADGTSLLAYPTHKEAYANLCSLLTKGNLRTEKGKCLLYKKDVYEHAKGMKFIAVAPEQLTENFDVDDGFKQSVKEYHEALGRDLYIGATRCYESNDYKKIFRILQLANHYQLPVVATNDVYYHNPQRRELQDILTCIREKKTIYNAGFLLHANAERYLKKADEMQRLFSQHPDAIIQTAAFAEACQFSLDSLKYQYPEELTTGGRTPQQELVMLTWQGAQQIFEDGLELKIAATIQYELDFIERMNYASYFLTVHDIVRFARSKDILCQGRGSAANSTVCFCLGITSVNPSKFDLLFERFISSARNEPPDIDVDFEHERREEVMQYIYQKYGRDRAAIIATVTQQHQKGAIRDVGKAMGLSVDTVNRLSKSVWEFTDEWFDEHRMNEQGIDLKDSHLKKVLELTQQYIGFPRQLGQHTGGFVITQEKLHHLCPILNARMENRTCIEWNKDDIDALGFMKVDVLALGMLTCIRKCFDEARQHHGRHFTLANIPQDDPAVYDMIGHADTIGVFQIESRAQQSMLPRLKPKSFYDLVIEVAIVRPGPIQGDMVHPYLRRRNGEEKEEYPSPELEVILKKTLGVPLFQEQAMQIAIVAAGFTPTEADELRRSMATFKLKGMVKQFHDKLISGMLQRGYPQQYAERIFKQLEGFGSYGFPESHAASFALLVYVSSWLKCYYPDVFACGLLNSQPMGFYASAQIVSDARRHQVEVRPVDINYSQWDNILEEKVTHLFALRLGFRQVKGLRQDDMQKLITGRKEQFTSINQLVDAGVTIAALEKLADADAFRSLGVDRRQALWEITALHDHPTGVFTGQPSESHTETGVNLPQMSLSEHVVQDYGATALSLKAHPVSFIREKLNLLHIVQAKDLSAGNNGDIIRVAGLVLVRQRPGTAGGVCFITIEDETGTANLVVFRNLFENIYRKQILHSKLLMVEGKLQKEGEVIHVIVRHCEDWSKLLRSLTASNKESIPVLTLSPRDENDGFPFKAENKRTQVRQVYQEELFPGARNFK
ncbi:error-prone DNA polymerase [Foetidibacter luteolus]|uniref:error-prone DNA polymerase n=1 Tax=Foetidibacter luteolus TaxID=2608880 RepID=UPI00129A5EF4|nr:error-prone DNA polymerase [Foetidibacter luteolus]